jgi:hypothetical protein
MPRPSCSTILREMNAGELIATIVTSKHASPKGDYLPPVLPNEPIYYSLQFCWEYTAAYTPWAPLWSSDHNSWLQTQKSLVRLLPDFSEKYWIWNGVHSAFLRIKKSYLNEKVGLRSRKLWLPAVRICYVDHAIILHPQNLALNSLASCSRGRYIRLRTKGHGVCFYKRALISKCINI